MSSANDAPERMATRQWIRSSLSRTVRSCNRGTSHPIDQRKRFTPLNCNASSTRLLPFAFRSSRFRRTCLAESSSALFFKAIAPVANTWPRRLMFYERARSRPSWHEADFGFRRWILKTFSRMSRENVKQFEEQMF
jgi:hypothetical protein